MQAHIRREATRPSSRVPTSPRSRSAESVAVRKVREKPDLSTDGFGGDSLWDPPAGALCIRGRACVLKIRSLTWFTCPPVESRRLTPDGDRSRYRGNAAVHRALKDRAQGPAFPRSPSESGGGLLLRIRLRGYAIHYELETIIKITYIV